MDAEKKEKDDEQGGHAEERMVHQWVQEGDLSGDGVAEPGVGADGHADGEEDEDDTPAEGSGLRRGDDLGEATLERLQILTSHLLKRHGDDLGWW